MELVVVGMVVGFGTLGAIGYLVFYKFMGTPPHLIQGTGQEPDQIEDGARQEVPSTSAR